MIILQDNDFDDPGQPTIMSGIRVITQIKMQNKFYLSAVFIAIP
jgi:hypothetical protein